MVRAVVADKKERSYRKHCKNGVIPWPPNEYGENRRNMDRRT